MDDRDLIFRLRRIYSAVDAIAEFDLSKFPAKEIIGDGVSGFMQDFEGTMTASEMANAAHSLIQNIASLRDHLWKWASDNGRSKSDINSKFEASMALMVMQDLFDREKHPRPSRDGGHSRKGPHLSEITRTLLMTTEARKGAGMVLQFGAGGVPVVTGSGTAKVIIDGEILDQSGNKIGNFYDVAMDAVKAWEELAEELGIVPHRDDPEVSAQ